MRFDLNEEIRNQIIFSMEDQGNSYVFDSVELKAVPVSSATKEDDRYYKIPEWGSINGFKLMERFVGLLRNPLAREALREVLFSGKGVFRNFKKVLKEYPEVERLWYTFKEREMNRLILDWYNTLCDSWGLEKLEEEPEETEDLVHDDFIFRDGDSEHDSENIFICADTWLQEIERQYPGEPGVVLGELWQNQRYAYDAEAEKVLIAETVDGDFAGYISVAPFFENAPHTAVLTMLFVQPRYRGLGIGRELLTQCLSRLKNQQVHWATVANAIIPVSAAHILRDCGFTQIGTGFIANL